MENTATKKEGRGIDAASLTAQIKQGVASIYKTDSWKDALTYNAKFWNYSFRNQLLIVMQKPEASRVAGFNTWKAVGRSVKKGEKGLAILAPLIGKDKRPEAPEGKKALFGFRVSYVFDISQTDGKDAPEYCHKLQGAAPAGLVEGLEAYAAGLGVTIERRPLGADLGGFVRKNPVTEKPEIVLNADNAGAQQAKTLIHELGHFLAEHLEKRGLEMSQDARELEAESAAFIVGAVLGVDFSEYSFGYLASWARKYEDAEARDKALEQAGAMAAKVAKMILTGLDAKKEAAA